MDRTFLSSSAFGRRVCNYWFSVDRLLSIPLSDTDTHGYELWQPDLNRDGEGKIVPQSSYLMAYDSVSAPLIALIYPAVL